uniref:Fibronectin type-III domain-containing protein n=1 Tax=Mola mola TaxID=94237 RepID=A0A3Q3VU13_MOLML
YTFTCKISQDVWRLHTVMLVFDRHILYRECSHVVFVISCADVLLLKDEQNPKCFTGPRFDFTCFFETSDNRTYAFLYNIEREKQCEMSVQKTVEGTFLHICSFPDWDVLWYVEIYLDVVECSTNTSIYKRTVSVEDHFLLEPPSNVSLHQTGQVGQLHVSWHSKALKYFEDNMMYLIRYSSKSKGQKTKEAREGGILDSLVPGEEVEVQVTVKCALNPSAGHWSSWSQPVRAVAPQSAEDISLRCYTCDLENITCQWNGSRYGKENEYKIFYKKVLSGDSGWAECHADKYSTELCSFRGDESTKFKVKLSSGPAALSRTFYTQEFSLNKSIKISPPRHPRTTLKKNKLCLKWEAPFPRLSAHLQYEVNYQVREVDAWMVSRQGPDTGTCIEVPLGSQYSVKVRSKPTWPIYSGDWSDWSDVLTGETPADRSTFLMLCILITMLSTTFILIFFLPNKLKLYYWPPVPNLDKVLQGYLTEMNGHRWNPPLTVKQCSEETTFSTVEIMSEDEDVGLGKSSEGSSQQLRSPERSVSSKDQADESPAPEAFPDYVTLSKDNVIHCPSEDTYVYLYEKSMNEKDNPRVKDDFFKICLSSCTDGSDSNPLCSGSDFLNHSYIPLVKSADRFNSKVAADGGPGNLYTNLPWS